MSFSTHEALSQMELTTLASLCIDEITQRRCHESADGRYCVELLRRATIEQTDQAWSLLQQCFSETIRAWIRNHSSRDGALLYDNTLYLLGKTKGCFRDTISMARYVSTVVEIEKEGTRTIGTLSRG